MGRPWPRHPSRAVAVAVAIVATLAGVTVFIGRPAAEAAARPIEAVDPSPPPDRVTDPDRVLGTGWRASTDRAVTSSSDEHGLHLLVADRRTGYQWRTAATLAEPGIETDQWIGRFCLTGSGREAVVVYAPRQYANREQLMYAGAFVAIVDLDRGTVRKLAERGTLAYYNPGCGAGETVAVSRIEGPETAMRTAVTLIDAASGATVGGVRGRGQVTSVLPVGPDVVAVHGTSLVRLTPAGPVRLVDVKAAPFRLVADGPRGVAFQFVEGSNTVIARYAGGTVSNVLAAPVGSVRLRAGTAGRVYVTGRGAPARAGGGLPSGWRAVDASVDSDVSTGGAIAVEYATTGQEAAGSSSLRGPDGTRHRVRIGARSADGAELAFSVVPVGGGAGTAGSPSLRGQADSPSRRAGSTSLAPGVTPWEDDRACAVPRNDPNFQTYQPGPLQVEWAADLAVRGQLTFTRPANWQNYGLPAFSPQGLFPMEPLLGGGYVPAQVLLGILAQESNLRQASWHIVDGSAGNPLTSLGYYGLNLSNPDYTKIDWSKADCGYGAAQVTDGMKLSPGGPTLAQKAVALDYATNIAAGLKILQQKWNETRSNGLIANNGDPRYIENWWFAIWAYNTGFHPWQPVTGQPWGVGWLNNPANPIYPPDRRPFLIAPLDTPTHNDNIGYDNAKHPSDWSYPERVLGWAHTSLVLPNYATNNWDSTYWTGTWPRISLSSTTFEQAQPGRFTFCVATVNNCDPAAPPHQPTGPYATEPPGPCQNDDLTQCWWHSSANWVDCAAKCGQEARRFTTVEPRPLISTIYPSQCQVQGLPASAVIIDDISTTQALGPNGCTPTWPTASGSFNLSFVSATAPNGSTIYPSKVDFHQAGTGFGGHLWFAHTQRSATSPLKVTGTWTPATRFNGWVRVLVHIPSSAAWTQQARYVIHTGKGDRFRYLNTNRQANAWIPLGTYDFSNQNPQSLELTNIAEDGTGTEDVAWDAVAFVPLPSKPQHFVVALGDSFGSGEGAGNYYAETDDDYDAYTWNACRRSKDAWARKMRLPGMSATVGALADGLNQSLDFQFVSCSGAWTDNVDATGPSSYWTNTASLHDYHLSADGQFREHTQIDSGVLSADTTLVLLSIGGNDAGFPAVMDQCARSDCANAAFAAATRQDIDSVQADIRSLLDNIHGRAPNARIVLVGYPRLFASYHQDCALARYSYNEIELLNALAEYMRDKQRETVQQKTATIPKLNFVDMVAGFHDHGACRIIDEYHPVLPEDIRGVVLGSTGDGDFRLGTADPNPVPCASAFGVGTCVSRSSFHPNAGGTSTYATAVTAALPTFGYP
jgi:hypothetical protein